MEEKKLPLLKCLLLTFGMYSALSFLWTAILSFGTSIAAESAQAVSDTVVDSSGISEFATRLVMADGAIALFAAVFGFSFLIFGAKNLPQTAKRWIHIILNYAAALVSTFIIHSTSNAEATTTGWVSMAVIWTFAFFIIYGVCMLVMFLVRKFRRA